MYVVKPLLIPCTGGREGRLVQPVNNHETGNSIGSFCAELRMYTQLTSFKVGWLANNPADRLVIGSVVYNWAITYGIHQKEHNTNKKFVRHFLIRKVSHFYGLPLDLCRKRIAVLFAYAPQFGETHRIFMGKASKCSAHRGISAAHSTPR